MNLEDSLIVSLAATVDILESEVAALSRRDKKANGIILELLEELRYWKYDVGGKVERVDMIKAEKMVYPFIGGLLSGGEGSGE